MSQNLNMLLQNYCRPVTVAGKTTHDLFPLEKECEEGKTYLAKAPTILLEVQEFDPSGLEQSYRDESTGAELPVFAVFNLEGEQRCTFEITPELLHLAADPTSLQAKMPLQRAQPFVKKVNARRMKAERTINIAVGILGILPRCRDGLFVVPHDRCGGYETFGLSWRMATRRNAGVHRES